MGEGANKEGLSVENLLTGVRIPVPRLAELLKSQDALVAIGTASAEIGGEGLAGEEARARRRAGELAKALAHSPQIKCPVFTSSWGKYDEGKGQPWQREIVILGLVRDKGAPGADLKEADLLDLMTAFSAMQEGQHLNPADYSQKDNAPRRFVDGP